jgi:hypothetical protein
MFASQLCALCCSTNCSVEQLQLLAAGLRYSQIILEKSKKLRLFGRCHASSRNIFENVLDSDGDKLSRISHCCPQRRIAAAAAAVVAAVDDDH